MQPQLYEARSLAKIHRKSLPKGTCERIIREIEKQSMLPNKTIKKKTIVSRVDRCHLTGIAPQKSSPLEGVEPLLVEYCLKLANIGQSLSKGQLISLAESIIDGTDYKESLATFKYQHKIFDQGGLAQALVGSIWYESFMRWHETKLKRTKGCQSPQLVYLRELSNNI
jgi:hypothetical protein